MATTEYRDLSAVEIITALCEPVPTLVLCHVHPDADALGSALALSLWLEKKGSPARVVCADEIPGRLRFLAEGVQDSILLTAVPQGFENARVITVDTASPAQLGALWEVFKDRISMMIDHHERGTRYADGFVVGCAATGEMIYDLIADSGEDMSGKCSELLYAAMLPLWKLACIRFL